MTTATSKKAFICFWTRFTNLHWITRLPKKRDVNNKRAIFKTKNIYISSKWTDQRIEYVTMFLLYVFVFVLICDHHVWPAGLQVNLVRLKQQIPVKQNPTCSLRRLHDNSLDFKGTGMSTCPKLSSSIQNLRSNSVGSFSRIHFREL